MVDFMTRVGRTLKDHFNEMLLCGVFTLLLVFVTHMSAVHNDSLASAGKDFAGQVLAALLAIMAAKKLSGG